MSFIIESQTSPTTGRVVDGVHVVVLSHNGRYKSNVLNQICRRHLPSPHNSVHVRMILMKHRMSLNLSSLAAVFSSINAASYHVTRCHHLDCCNTNTPGNCDALQLEAARRRASRFEL